MEKLFLPDGTYIEIPTGKTEEEKAAIIQKLIDDETVKTTPEAGALADWRPEGAATSWLYDVGVVAPYEATRKFFNSTMSLTEGLGDTLGEKTNLGGFRYGKEADNGFLEYVPYDDAVKLGNVKGLLAPITGNIGVNDSRHVRGFFYDPDSVNPEDATETLTASFVEGGIQFILGYVTGQKILKAMKVGQGLTQTERIGKATVAGAFADFVGFDEMSGRLTDMVVEHFPEMEDTWLGYLQSDPDDTWWEGRMKNSLEGLGLGAFAELMMVGLRGSKGYIAKNMDERLRVKDEQIIKDSQEAIIRSKSALDNATTIGEKMKIINDELEKVKGLRKPKLKLSQSDKIRFLQKITKDDLNIQFEKWKKGELTSEEAFTLPRSWINLDTFDKEIVTESFVRTIKAMHEAVEGGYDKVSRDFSDEVIKRKAITEYGGDVKKLYKDFEYLAKTTEGTAPLIYAHEMMLYSMINALPSIQRQVGRAGSKWQQKNVDELLAYIFKMQQHRTGLASNTGGNLRALGIAKKEFERAGVIRENLQAAIDEFNNFGKGNEKKAKEVLLKKLSTLDNPSVARTILNFVAKNRTWDVANELWINALLSNPKTQLVNLVGNAITAMAKPIEDKMGASISALLSRGDIGRVTKYNAISKEASSTFAGLFQSLGDAVKLGGKAFKQGELILEGSSGMSKIDTAITKSVPKALGGEIVRLPSRALNAGDEVFKQINYRGKLKALAVSFADEKGLKGTERSKFIQRYFDEGFDEFGRGTNPDALVYAREATYTNELTGFMAKFQDMINTYPALKQLFPFIRTPFQLAKSVVDRSPAALTYRWRHILGESNDAKMIAKARGQLAMGGILFSTAYVMAKMGVLQSATNRTDDDWSKYIGLETSPKDGVVLDKFKDAELMRLKKTDTNFKPYAFLINGNQYPFGRLDPYGMFFGLVADISTNYQYLEQREIERLGADMQLFLLGLNENNPISSADKAGIASRATMSAIRDNLLSKTYLQTLHEIVDAVFSNDERKFQKYWNNKISSYYPNVLSKIVNDPYIRDARTFIENIKKRTGLGERVTPKFNFMGKAHKYDEGAGKRLFDNMISPITVSEKQPNIIVDEILRLGKAPQVLKKFQWDVDLTKYNYKGKSAYYRLNDLIATVKIQHGQRRLNYEQALTELIQSDEYLAATDPLKTDKTISNKGTKFALIQAMHDKFVDEAILQFKKERQFFTHEDDERRTLQRDVVLQRNNRDAILQENYSKESLKKNLRPLILWGQR